MHWDEKYLEKKKAKHMNYTFISKEAYWFLGKYKLKPQRYNFAIFRLTNDNKKKRKKEWEERRGGGEKEEKKGEKWSLTCICECSELLFGTTF